MNEFLVNLMLSMLEEVLLFSFNLILSSSVSSDVRNFNDDAFFVDNESNSVTLPVHGQGPFFLKHLKLHFEIEINFTLQNRLNKIFSN